MAATKKTARKKATRKKATRKAGARASTSAASLRERAAQAEAEVPQTDGNGMQIPAMSIGGLEIPDVDLEQLEGTVRSVVDFVEENPLAAAAMALGAGVALTSLYWDKFSNTD